MAPAKEFKPPRAQRTQRGRDKWFEEILSIVGEKNNCIDNEKNFFKNKVLGVLCALCGYFLPEKGTMPKASYPDTFKTLIRYYLLPLDA